MSNVKIELPDCPDALQAAVRDKLTEPDCELLSVTRTECTPYKDKSIISGRYRAIVNRMNLVTVLECSDDGALKNMVYENSLIWGGYSGDHSDSSDSLLSGNHTGGAFRKSTLSVVPVNHLK